MSVLVVLNGQTYTIPEPGDSAWGQNLTDYFVAQSTGLLQKAGGNFFLTAEVDFGATYGLKSTYFKSRTTGAAASGALRLASTDGIAWRNNLGSADKTFAKNTSDQLTYAGTAFLSSAGIILPAGFPALTGDVTTSAGSVATTVAAIQGTTVSGVTGSGNVAFSASPTFTGTMLTAAIAASGALSITSSAVTPLDITASVNTVHQVLLKNTNAGSSAQSYYRAETDGGVLYLGISSTAADSATGFIQGTGAGGIQINASHASGVLKFYSANTLAATFSTAQLLRLHAYGTGLIHSDSSGNLTSSTLVNSDISASAAIDFSKLATLTSANILVGSVGNVATSVAMSGDITITNAGVTAIGATKVTNAMLAGSIAASKLVGSDIATVGTVTSGTWSATAISAAKGGTAIDTSASTGLAKVSSGTWSVATLVNADVSATAAIAYSKLASLTSAHILVGSGSNVATDVAMSGDVTIDNTGATTIGATKVTNAMLAGSIAYSKLSLTGAILNADLAGSIAASKLVGSDIATVGTVTSGTWSATAIAETKGGTNQTTYATGDILYASAANTLSKLTGNISTTMSVLTQTGGGAASAAPAWTSTIGTGNVVRAISPTFTGTSTFATINVTGAMFSTTCVTDTSTGTINNLTSANRTIIRFNQSTTITLNGIAAATNDGQWIVILNNTGNNLSVVSGSGSATGAQIQTSGSSTITVANGGSLMLVYNSSTSVWWAVKP